MTVLSLLLLALLLGPPQDTKNADTAAERAKRTTVVEKIVITPANPVQVFPSPPRQIQINQNIVVNRAQVIGRQLTLELKEVPASEDDVEENRQVVPQARPTQIDQYALSSVNFDRWVFEADLTDKARRDRLNSSLAGKLLVAKMDLGIDPEQEEKLRLAGIGDIKRFLDRVETARTNFEAVRQDFNAGRNLLSQLDPLTAEYQAGPFGPGSVFQKTLSKIRGGKEKNKVSQGRE